MQKGQSQSVDLTGLDMSALDMMFPSPTNGVVVPERARSKSEQHDYPDLSGLQDYDMATSPSEGVDMDFGGTGTPRKSGSEGVHRYSSSARKRLAPEKLRKMKSGETKFNINPKIGLAYLQQATLVGDTSEEVAEFLYASREFLSKRRIGEYLGNNKDFNQSVLGAYCALLGLEFVGLKLDEVSRM
jgi:Sec7-like guanine-nucleotide exchange factor